jgi:hypothetical protein
MSKKTVHNEVREPSKPQKAVGCHTVYDSPQVAQMPPKVINPTTARTPSSSPTYHPSPRSVVTSLHASPKRNNMSEKENTYQYKIVWNAQWVA